MSAAAYQLSRRVSVMHKAGGTDDEGEAGTAWTELRKAWASEPKSLSGLQAIKADAVASTVRVSIRTRWCTDIVAGMRFVDAGVEYHVLAVLPLAGRRFVDFACEVLS